MEMDKIFKIGLLVLGVFYLVYLFCPVMNQVGRYRYHKSGSVMSVMDTANADVYYLLLKDEKWVKSNPRTGKSSTIPFKKTNK